MAFWNKAVDSLKQMVSPHQEEDRPQVMSNRADGGFSGYQHKVVRRQPEQPAAAQSAYGFENMMPSGVDPSVVQQFQQVGGQTGSMPQQNQPVQGFTARQPMQQTPPQQPNAWQQSMRFGTSYQQPVQQTPPQQPNAWQQSMRFNTSYQQPVQPPYQQPVPPQAMPPQAAPQQVQGDGHIFYMPGTYVGEDGSSYSLVMRVAQITGVASCFSLIEFMQNREAAIVNAEQITDVVEADRCMDLLFGAAYAMGHTLTRVSGKQIYLITPANVQVQPYEGLRRMGEDDIDRRWPGAQKSSWQGGFVQAAANDGYRQDDFAGGFGRPASRRVQPGAYTDYGGFGARR